MRANSKAKSMLLLLWWAVGSALAAPGGPIPARFRVTPQGLPQIRCPLFAAVTERFPGELSLVHRIIFDGEQYRSVVRIPLLSSSLVALDKPRYRWHSGFGREAILSLEEPVQTGGRSFLLRRAADDVFAVATADESEVYEYRDGRPTRARVLGRDFHWEYSAGRMRVHEAAGSGVALEANLRADDRFDMVTIAGVALRLVYDDRGSLVRCRDESSGDDIARFCYRGGLLTGAMVRGKIIRYEWQRFNRSDYSLPIQPVAPYVAWDGIYRYQATIEGGRFLSFRYVGAPDETGTWRFDLKKGEAVARKQ